MKGRILLVEDDDTIVFGLSELLRQEGFFVTAVSSLGDAVSLSREEGRFGLILLDLGLPDGEGWEFLENRKSGAPVIILSAREEEREIIRGLDLGADDYVTKPFKAGELLSRIRAVLRRQGNVKGREEVLCCGSVVLDRERTRVMESGREICLTAGEYRLLLYFMENKNRTLTRNALLQYLWDNCGDYVNDNTLTVTVKRLREKLGETARQAIKTVRGIGYRMEDYQ